MLTIIKIFENAIEAANKRNWDKIYVCIDWHDTITKGTYDNQLAMEFLPDAIPALKLLSYDERFVLILFTSSYEDKCQEFVKLLKSKGIKINYINENPEIENTQFGDFSRKFYYNILLDDKAGFEYTDWTEIKNWMRSKIFGSFYSK